MIYFNPFHFLARRLVLILARRIVPATIFTVTTTLIHSIYSLVSAVGIYRTIKLLLNIRTVVSLGGTYTMLRNNLLNIAGLNVAAIETLGAILQPEWALLLNNRIPFRRIISITTAVFTATLFFKSTVLWMIRLFFGAVISALGILYVPLLSGIKWLRNSSTYILAFLPLSFLPDFAKPKRSWYNWFNDYTNGWRNYAIVAGLIIISVELLSLSHLYNKFIY